VKIQVALRIQADEFVGADDLQFEGHG
jgi:hypothetical protein